MSFSSTTGALSKSSLLKKRSRRTRDPVLIKDILVREMPLPADLEANLNPSRKGNEEGVKPEVKFW